MLRAAWICFDVGQVVPQIRVGIRDRVCKVDCVRIVLEVVLECRCVEGLAVVGNVFADSILEVTDVVAALVPSNVLLLCLLLAVDRDLHSIVEKTVWFGVVQQVEADFGLCPRVLNLEEEPLGVSLGIDIVGHEQVVLHIRDFLGQVQVAALEPGFKYQRLVVFAL